MKAIIQDRYGPPDTLEVRDVDPPVPADDEVLVRVHAASLNARDWHLVRGDPYLARLGFGLRRPKVTIRGTDFAGRVEAVGQAVTRFRPGDDVFGEDEGAFAEFVCAPENVVETTPANLTFAQAAALPLAANTAWMGLHDLGQMQSGQRVLVNGASGGVGTFAVQLAKAHGTEVTGVCRTRNVELVRSLGADHVVDYTREDVTRTGRRYDLVLDLVGNHPLAALRRVLTPTGTLVLAGGGIYEGGSLLGPIGLVLRGMMLSRIVRHHTIRILTAVPSREKLAAVRELVANGSITPAVERTYSLDEVPEAIRYLESEHARAKVVVTV